MTSLQSSQNFIRALKASSDPPSTGGLCKIDIARQAWDNNSFYLPGKAEIIAEWILSTLYREKSWSASVCNPQYWKLLLDIFSDKAPSNIRPLKAWLSPLLHRISIQPILSSILEKYHEIDSPEELIDYASSCIRIMWPISVQKMSLENISDLFGLLLRKANEGDLAPGIIDIAFLVTSSYRASLGNSANKKKFYQLFLQVFFSDWLRILARNSLPPTSLPLAHPQLLENIYEVGTDTLFNLDILRHLSGNRSTDQSATLFEHLHTAHLEASYVLPVMPRLFLSYVQALKRHRGAVFNQGSNVGAATMTDEVNAASMRFFANCEAALTGWSDDSAVSGSNIWKTRLGLLEAVLDEKLFDVQQGDAATVLNKMIEDAVEVLSGSWKSEHNGTISATVKCLHKIGQIDCDLLLPSLSRILPSLLPMPVTDSAPRSFLDLILDYHTKTRTLNTHLTNLLTSFMPTSFPPSGIVDSRGVYELCFSGHVLGSQHLMKFGTMIKSFLTPGQTPKLVEKLVETLRQSWQTFFDVAEGNVNDVESPKKRKKEKNAEDERAVGIDGALESTGHDVDSLAVSFSLQAHLALIVFSKLPVQNLTEDSATTVRGIIIEFRENLVRRALETLLRTKRLLGSEKKKRSRELSTGSSGWAIQVVAAAMLRLNYAFGVARELGLDGEPDLSKVIERAKGIIVKEGGKGNLIAELELEIFRTLLFHMSTRHVHQDEAVEILDNVFSYLNGSFKPSERGWSGLPCRLKSPESGALALFHLILERWLPFMDNLASPSQLTNLVHLILSIDLSANPVSTDVNLRPEHLLLRVLHSAEFWEMRNIQSAFLSHLVKITDRPNAPLGEIESVAYHLLLYIPAEYYNRATRAHFVRRALAADIQLVEGFREKGNKQEEGQQRRSLLRKLITLRAFLKRVIELVGFERASDVDLGDFVVHLMSFDCPLGGREYEVFTQVTLDLSVLYFSELAKDSVSNSGTLLKIINSFSQYSALVNARSEPRKLQFKVITSLLDAITRLNSSNLPSQCMAAMRSLHADLSKSFSKQLQDIQQLPITHYLKTLVGWCCVLTLRKWLGESSSGEEDGSSGERFVSLIVREHGDEERLDDIRDSVFALLRAELALISDSVIRPKKLDLIFATFVLFYGASKATTRAKLDKHISLISQSLAPADYLHGLNLVSDWLSDSLPTGEREIIVHLSILLLRDHPQNALKHIQAFTTQCLNIFASRREFVHSTIELRLLILEFMLQHCSERPAALRSVDIGNVWIILFRFLEPSEEHDEVTTLDIFHKIVATVSALVRLRRDLVTPVLPHLGLILRQLLSLIRSCRPQLGTKQTSLVMQTLPRWVNVKRPLGGEAGRTLSRLLETLNSKTVIRSHTAGDTQKTESLAKPFSKHAAYVLTAYIEALNDPLCVVTLEMRRELEPGLFTLCGFMGEHARDALVVGLDANGKALLKLIWREYEKQRYAGEG